MLTDATLNFVAPGSPLSLVGGAGTNIPSTNIIDETGAGSGNASGNIIGTAAVFGADLGVGEPNPQILAVIGTACETATSATLNMALQGAPDDGSNTPGAWTTYSETGPIEASALTAGQKLRLDLPVAFPANARPRFYRLLFQVPAATDFTAGTIAYAVITMTRDDIANVQAAKNFVVQ